MKTKINFMLPDLATAVKVRDALLLGLVENKYIHFLAKQGTKLDDLNQTSAIEGSNLMHEGEKGILYGMGFGFLAGLSVLYFPDWITVSPSWYTQSYWYVVLIVTTLFGAIATAVGAALLGCNVFNSDIDQYKARIEKGEILMIVTVRLYEAHKVRNIVNKKLEALARLKKLNLSAT